MTRVDPPAQQPVMNLWTAAVEPEATVYPEAEIYAGAARGPRPHVPLSSDAVNRRLTEAARPPANPDNGTAAGS